MVIDITDCLKKMSVKKFRALASGQRPGRGSAAIRPYAGLTVTADAGGARRQRDALPCGAPHCDRGLDRRSPAVVAVCRRAGHSARRHASLAAIHPSHPSESSIRIDKQSLPSESAIRVTHLNTHLIYPSVSSSKSLIRVIHPSHPPESFIRVIHLSHPSESSRLVMVARNSAPRARAS